MDDPEPINEIEEGKRQAQFENYLSPVDFS
jgi:hypothetical protein